MPMARSFLLFTMLFTAFTQTSLANSATEFDILQSTVTGVVTDENGVPLPGASIVVKGTTNGAVTDFDGNYSINVDGDGTLVVSYVGYKTMEVPVNGRSTVNVGLETDASQLEEVVVVGYGTQKRGEVTAAIASVEAEAIQKIATSNSIDAIKGQVAGVDIQSGGGRPGQGSSVRIRGRRSINASNDPLYVVDGIPQLDANSIADIAPGDIQSMQILKDAAATAIYGSRGANGVILISTKRGRSGDTKVSYNSHFGVTSALRLVDMMNGAEFAQLRRESKRFKMVDGERVIAWDGQIPNDDEVFEDEVELKSIAEGRSTNWVDEVVGNGWQTNHQGSVSGGSEKTTFNTSVGYFNEQGIISNQDFERFSGRINLDHKINDIFKVGMSFVITHSIQNWGSNATMGEALAINPLGVPYDAEGNLLFLPTNDGIRTNPLNELEEDAYVDERKVTRILAPISLDINIAEGLQWKTTFGPDLRYRRRGWFAGSLTNSNRGGPGRARTENTQNFGYTLENLLTYNKTLNDKHNFKVTLLQSVQSQREEYYEGGVANIPYEYQTFYNLGSASVKGNIRSRLEEKSLSSYMGRLNYDIDGKYLFQASMRADGSSVLAEGNKWAYFPGVSAGWRISEEDFMAESNTFSDLKLRASYGEVGNSDLDPYQTAGRLQQSVYAYGESSALGYGLNEIPNPELGWEISKTVDIGLDYGLFNNRISGSIDWFDTKTSDILLRSALPPTSGYPFILENIGSTHTSGLEFNINAGIVETENFSWDIGFNIAGYKEEITALNLRDENGKPIDDTGSNLFIGQPIQVYFDYEKSGIWQADEVALAESIEEKVPGEIKLRDLNGDGDITPDDRKIIGTNTPDYYGGLTNTLRYKNLDLSFFFIFRQGQTIRSRFHDSNNSLFGRYNNLDTDYWTLDNPTNVSPRPNENQERPRNASTMSYFDGSFIKLRNASLGYNFPSSITEKLGLSNLRLYVTGQNLLVITDYETFDPEVEEGDNANALSSGIVPSSKMFSMGLNVTF